MVATRRGTCGSSPAKNTSDQTDSAAEGSATIRRTRRGTVIVMSEARDKLNSDTQHEDTEEQTTVLTESASPPKKETRGSKRRPTNKQSDSTNEADVSESESCCSVTSDVQALSEMQSISRNRRRTVQRTPASVAQEETAKGQLCSSPCVETPRRSTRGQKKLASVSAPSHDHSDAESCSSVASLSKAVETRRITRALGKTAREDSEAESCSSVVSGPSDTGSRKSTRIRAKSTMPTPSNSEPSKTTETPSMMHRTRGGLAKAKFLSENQVYDSDGCQSGPSLSPWRTTCNKVYLAGSDSESLSTACMSHDSPSSGGGKATPCSSRTVSANRKCGVSVSRSRITVQVMTDVLNISDKEHEADGTTPTETTINVVCLSDGEDVEKIEEKETDKTLTGADLECTNSEDLKPDIVLTFDKDKDMCSSSAEMVKCENKQGVHSENTDDQTHQAENQAIAIQEPYIVENQMDATPTRATVTEELSISQRINELSNKVQMSVVKIAEERFVSDCGAIIDLGSSDPASKSVPENTSTAQTEDFKTSTENNFKKEVFSLLDSSDDEESDVGLSDEERCEDNVRDDESEEEMYTNHNQPGPSRALDLPSNNELFVIDTRPGLQPSKKYYLDATQHEKDVGDSKAALDEDEDFVDEEDEEEDEDSKVLFNTRKPVMTLSSSIDPGLRLKELGGLYISFDGTQTKSVSNNLKKLKEQKNQDELLKKSIISADFEKKDAIPPYKESKQIAKMKRREERAKTTGDGWFNMKAPELTEELKNDLRVLKMRAAMDPKRFYKKNDREGFPKYFEVGTVVDNPVDFYHSRVPNKQRKRTIVEELLADAEFRSFNKRKYQEIMTEKAKEAAGKMNKKKKNHTKK